MVESYNSDNDIITSYRRKPGKDAESSKDSRSKEKKSSSTSKEDSQSQHKSLGKSVHAEEPSQIVKEFGMQQDHKFVMGDNDEQPVDKEVTKADWKTKAVTYELKWIEDLVPELWSPVVMNYDQHAYFGTSHWVTRLTIMKKYDYGHLEEIEVRQDDQQLYKFKEEWEIARDAKINPFEDVLVFRRMDKPPKDKDGAWHAKVRILDPDGEEFTKTLQSIPTTRKLSEKERPREIINLDHYCDNLR
nr:hypothetical protein [Tanacetum cinerariifolium]